jgi:hypothetical protein
VSVFARRPPGARRARGDGLVVRRQLIEELLGGTDRVLVALVIGASGRFRRRVGIGRWRLKGGRSRGGATASSRAAAAAIRSPSSSTVAPVMTVLSSANDLG